MKIKMITLAALLFMACGLSVKAATVVGTPFTYNGQTFLITTNSTGGFEVQTFGVNGTNVVTAPVSLDQAMQVVSAWIGENNPANANYYATNEWEAKIAAGYLQNSGQAVASIGAVHWGWPWQNVGLGADLLQGNNQGQDGTAGFNAEIDYRKVIGDVAGIGGVIGGYDNWNHKAFGGFKIGAEYRQNPHLGEFVDVAYAFESVKNDRGLIIFGGICYAF